MPKLSTEKMLLIYDKDDKSRNIEFKFDITIDKEGWFGAKMPLDIVKIFEDSKVQMEYNRLRTYGHFYEKTREELLAKIKKACDHVVTKTMTSERIVLIYSISSYMHYFMAVDGTLHPNGEAIGDFENGKWQDGIGQHHGSTDSNPYNISLYVEPFVRREFVFLNGSTKVEYARLTYDKFGLQQAADDATIKWLHRLIRISNRSAYQHNETKEIDYTPEVGAFFKSMIEGFWAINEKIKNITDPESIARIAASNFKMIG